jgi:hypothetical protein
MDFDMPDLEIIQILGRLRTTRTGHDLEPRVEHDHGGGKLSKHPYVTLNLRGTVFDHFHKWCRTAHHRFQVSAVDGDGKIRVIRQEALDIGQRGVTEFDKEFFTNVVCSLVKSSLFQ